MIIVAKILLVILLCVPAIYFSNLFISKLITDLQAQQIYKERVLRMTSKQKREINDNAFRYKGEVKSKRNSRGEKTSSTSNRKKSAR